MIVDSRAESRRQLVVLAGGRGSRIAERLGDRPKGMLEVGGKPLLEHQLVLARAHGFTDVLLCTGFRGDVIEDYFGDGERLGLRVEYAREPAPLGTAGAVVASLARLAERFVVLYGDVFLDVDLDRMWRHHRQHGADATLFLHPNDHPYDSDLIEIEASGRISAIHTCPHPEGTYLPNLVNAALYVLERRVVEEQPPGEADFARHVFPRLLARGAHLSGYRSPEYIKDMGTPARHDRVLDDLRSGGVARRSLRSPGPAVFLDQDGTLVRHVGYLRRKEQLELAPGAARALRQLNRHGVRTAIVTNQPVVARGETSFEELQEIHNKLETLLGEEGAYVDRIYFCPHHPDAGFPGERPELKIACACRKPGTALLERAREDLAIDPRSSWFIGDSTVDVRTARAAGVRAVLLRTGEAGRDRRFPDRPDYVFGGLEEAVEFVLRGHAIVRARLEPVVARARPGQPILIGGLAHAGKSTIASALGERLAELGHRCEIVSLDNWIRSAADRRSAALPDVYDYRAISEAVGHLQAGRTIRMPHYDRARRLSVPDGETLTLPSDAILVVEGVPALEVFAPDDLPALRIYTEVHEAERERRFFRDREWRGLDPEQTRSRFDERESSENAAVRAGRATAHVVVEGSNDH